MIILQSSPCLQRSNQFSKKLFFGGQSEIIPENKWCRPSTHKIKQLDLVYKPSWELIVDNRCGISGAGVSVSIPNMAQTDDIINKDNEWKYRFTYYWTLPIINHIKFRLCRTITIIGNVVADVFYSIFKIFTSVEANAGSILVEDGADTLQVEEY